MKTIAISIEDATLRDIDRIAAGVRRARATRHGSPRANRSKVIRAALREYVERHDREQRESRERKIIASHRHRLLQQARALVSEQAEP